MLKYTTKEEVEQIINNKDYAAFNRVLERTANMIIETMLTRLPALTIQMLKTEKVRVDLVGKFFKDNPEFEQFKDITKEVIMQIDMKNPNADFQKILDEAKPIIQTRIEILKKARLMPLDKPTEVNLNGNGAI